MIHIQNNNIKTTQFQPNALNVSMVKRKTPMRWITGDSYDPWINLKTDVSYEEETTFTDLSVIKMTDVSAICHNLTSKHYNMRGISLYGFSALAN